MKNTCKVLLLSAAVASLLMGYAFADVAAGPMYAMIFGVPLLAAAILIIVAALIIRSVLRASRAKRDDAAPARRPERPGEPGGESAAAPKSEWTNRDPWDVKRDRDPWDKKK